MLVEVVDLVSDFITGKLPRFQKVGYNSNKLKFILKRRLYHSIITITFSSQNITINSVLEPLLIELADPSFFAKLVSHFTKIQKHSTIKPHIFNCGKIEKLCTTNVLQSIYRRLNLVEYPVNWQEDGVKIFGKSFTYRDHYLAYKQVFLEFKKIKLMDMCKCYLINNQFERLGFHKTYSAYGLSGIRDNRMIHAYIGNLSVHINHVHIGYDRTLNRTFRRITTFIEAEYG